MSISLLNTILKPANQVLLDASLIGDSFSMSIGRRSGWFKYGVDDLDGSIYTSTQNTTMTFPDASNRNLKVWKGGTSGPAGILSIGMYNQPHIESLDLSKLDSLDYLTIQLTNNLKSLKIGETKDDTFELGFLVYQTDISILDLSSIKNIGGLLFIRQNPSLKNLILPAELSGKSKISNIDIYDNTSLGGVLDISNFKYINDNCNMRLYNNDFNNIIFPDVSAKVGSLIIRNNNLSGNLDLSSLKGLSGAVNLDNNPINTITWPETSTNFTEIRTIGCDISILDLSNLTGGIGRLNISSNFNSLNEIILPDSSVPFSSFRFNNNYNFTTLDVSNRIFKECDFNGNSCSSLQKIIFPDASCSFTYFYLQTGKLQGILDVSNHYFSNQIMVYNHPDMTKFLIDEEKCSNLIYFSLRFCNNLSGGYDLSNFNTLTTLNVEWTDIGYVIPPADASGLIYNINGSLCASNGIVDLSTVASLSNFEIWSTDASVIYWPYDVGTKEIVNFRINSCNFTGVIDLSVFPSIRGIIEISSNPKITGLILPDSSSSNLYAGGAIGAYGCNLQGHIDLSRQKNRQFLDFSLNPSLNSIDMPILRTNTNYHVRCNFNGCSLNQTTVDKILSDYDNLFQQINIGYNFILDVGGGTNAVPTDGSLNSNIISLQNKFAASSRTLTLTYNL